MPERYLLVRWPDGPGQRIYSPCEVVEEYFAAGQTYPVADFVERSREALQSAAASGDLAPVDLEQDVPDGEAHIPPAPPPPSPVMSAPVAPVPRYSSGGSYAADLPGPNAGSSRLSPPQAYSQAPLPPAGQLQSHLHAAPGQHAHDRARPLTMRALGPIAIAA